MRILICGGRDYTNWLYLSKVLDGYNWAKPVFIIHGNAKGADSLAARWAAERDAYQLIFPANWKQYGKSAGFIRNTQMLKEGKPDLVLAFPGGRGTEMMIDLAKEAGIRVQIHA